MEHPCSAPDESGDADLDPRIQIELEKLNNATDEINKLEIELDEANTTFRLLLNESTRRLKLLSKKLGSCIERARPYYDSLEVAKKAQLECQRAAVQFQRANEIHQAAKETVALAEQRFLSKQHEWQFDNAWQEMLNHATIKVMDAENQKAESGREHQKRATLFNAAEQKVQQLEQRLRRSIANSRPYFEEKALCQGQLATQKERVETLQRAVAKVKSEYAESLKELERISEEIHYKRGSGCLRKVSDDLPPPHGPREPGVGAELNVYDVSEFGPPPDLARGSEGAGKSDVTNKMSVLADYELELDRCDIRSLGSLSVGTSSAAVSEKDDSEAVDEDDDEEDLETLKLRVRELAIRPVDGGEGQSSDRQWEEELSATVEKLDKRLQRHESDMELAAVASEPHKPNSIG
ncbi:SH3 domain-binding protein 5 homolog [Periplaneta americana]|uniref:SH3 domain-binding protein 5 homolog n=1 Tax=Periplaneta americana TaxID=6978 RepID=UPI0037E713E7